MKKFSILILAILNIMCAKAQDMKVESMEPRPFEIMKADKIRYDLNGNKCALVRVLVNGGDFSFSGNIIGDVTKDGSEYILYMSPGTKNVQIKHPMFKTQMVDFQDFNIEGLNGGMVYIINLNLVGYSKEDMIKAQRDEAKNDPNIGGFDNGYAWVDLGLPSGNRWAAWNVGAYSKKELGDKFMWAQRFSPQEFTEEYYVHANEIMEIPDHSGNPDYDSANLNMGMNWRMPLKEEFQELIEHCNWSYYSQEQEFKVTGPNGKSIYFSLDPKSEVFTEFWSSSHAEEFEIMGTKAPDIRYLGLCDGSNPEIMTSLFPYEGRYVRAIYDPYTIKISSNDVQHNLPLSGNSGGHEWIDLGLSVNWASSNIGASDPEECGTYFAWGDPKIKSDFPIFDDKVSKFEDPATIHWREKWRMPTCGEFHELRDKCQWMWTGKGYNVTGPNGNSIYLPAAGVMQFTSKKEKDVSGHYWSSLDPKGSREFACNMSFVADDIIIDWYPALSGLSIRPVMEKNNKSISAQTVNTHSEKQNSDVVEDAKSWMDKGMGSLKNGDTLDFITYVTKAAEMDNTPAQLMLAMAFSGIASSEFPMIEPNLEESVKWGLRAADKGDPTAQLLIGVFYLKGIGVPKDKAKGLEYIKKSADQGLEQAIKVYQQQTA